MSRTGSHVGLLDPLHADGCNGKEFTTCRPLQTTEYEFVVVFMAWCSGCGAADFDEV